MAGRRDEGGELAVGHFVRVDPETAHARLAHRPFLGIAVGLTHQKGAAGKPDRRVGDTRALALARRRDHCRSEEHTSELQSLMRISYAVFRFTKTNTQQT